MMNSTTYDKMEQKGGASNLDTHCQQEDVAGVEISEQNNSNGELSMNSSQNEIKLTMLSLPSDSCDAICDSTYSAIVNGDDSNIRCGSGDSHKEPQNNKVTNNSQNGNVTMCTKSVENTDKKSSEDINETDTQNKISLEDNSLDGPEAEEEVEHLEDGEAGEDLKDGDNEVDELEDVCDTLDDNAAGENVDDDAEEPEAIPANGPAGNDQHDLLGPRRRRHEARRQRQEAANPVSRDRVDIAIPPALADQWREIGFQWGLENDNDIARMLLQHYEDVRAGRPPRPPPDPRCRGCRGRMRPAPCHQCGPNQHHVRFDKDEGKGGGSGGDGGGGGGFGGGGFSGGGARSGFCGRCRD